MAKSWNTNRNINKNIKSYSAPGREIFAKPFPALTKVLAILLAIFIPLTSILLAANIIFRVPDLYNFEINRSSAIAEADINVEEDGAIGSLMSSYMLHKTDKFQMLHEFHGGKVGLFTNNDQASMEKYRAFLDKTFVILIVLLVLCLGGFVFMIATKWIRRLRKSYNAALIFYMVILLGSIAVFLNNEAIVLLFNIMIGVDFEAEDILMLILSPGFVTASGIAIIAISFLVMLIGNSVIRYLTKDYRMFE